MTYLERTPALMAAENAIAAHNRARCYIINDPQHALTMLLADLLVYADSQASQCDLDKALMQAREMIADDEDWRPQ
jgi:hypothetical protein